MPANTMTLDDLSALRWNEAMLAGDFEAAWRESDAIAERGAAGPLALWDRAPFSGNRVLIRCLHGYGDAIQFLRYAAMLRRTAAEVIVETHPEMISVVELIDGVDRVVTWPPNSVARHEWDQQIEVTELPWAFRSELSTIPHDVPYIRMGVERSTHSACAPFVDDRLRVGLMWAASGWNPARSIRLSALLPLLGVPGVRWFSFQRAQEREELAALGSPVEVFDTAIHAPSIVDTAADLLHMDLVITVDTMLAHLAGALGRTVWLMLPFSADWRWMQDRDDSPWYPGMRLFRQHDAGEWRPVVDRIADELARLQASFNIRNSAFTG